jgi:hypothetical protein
MMREALRAGWLFLKLTALLVIGYCLLAVFFPALVEARWKPEYAALPQEVRDWFATRELTPAAQQRFHFKSCCAQSDVVQAKFAVSKLNGADEWFYQLAGEAAWKRVPPDIVHPDEHAPSGEAVLFVFMGEPTCFFPPQGGI